MEGYGMKVVKGKLILKGPNREQLEQAEKAIRALLPSGNNAAASHSDDEMLSPGSFRPDHKRQLSLIDDDQKVALTDLPELVLSSPSAASDMTEDLMSPSMIDDMKTPIEEDTIPEETVNIEAIAEYKEPVEEVEPMDPDLPDTWDHMPKDVNCLAALIEPDSEEWNLAKEAFDFMSNIKTVERIQNKQLWRAFVAEKEALQSAGKSAESSMLWCGSMSTNPEDVYDSTKGFGGDSSYQFWKKSSYCNVFAFSTANGSRQLFLAETVTGGRSRMSIKNTPAYPSYLVTFR